MTELAHCDTSGDLHQEWYSKENHQISMLRMARSSQEFKAALVFHHNQAAHSSPR